MDSAQFISLLFGQRCDAGIEISIGSKGDCYDNSVAESFFATLKKDLIHRRSWPTKGEARAAIFEFIEAFYNRERRHSLLGYLAPAQFEQQIPTSEKREGEAALQNRVHETGRSRVLVSWTLGNRPI